MIKRYKRFAERFIEGILTISGSITSLAVLLIVVFLFKEGFGLFGNSAVENGYVIALNAENPVRKAYFVRN